MAEKMESIGETMEAVQKDGDRAAVSREDIPIAEEDALVQAIFSPELEDRIGERIAAEVERRFQSAKDKRFARLEQQFGALQDFQNTLEEKNPARRGEKLSSFNPQWLEGKAQKLLEAAGLGSDPEVQALFQDTEYSPDVTGYVELLGDITEIALRRANRPRGRAATVTQPTGGGTPEPDLKSEYEQKRGKLRPGDINGLLDLKRQYRKKGLAIF